MNQVKVPFSVDTVEGMYNDVLYIDAVEWVTLTDEQLEAMKQQRADNWVAFVTIQSEVTTEQTDGQ